MPRPPRLILGTALLSKPLLSRARSAYIALADVFRQQQQQQKRCYAEKKYDYKKNGDAKGGLPHEYYHVDGDWEGDGDSVEVNWEEIELGNDVYGRYGDYVDVKKKGCCAEASASAQLRTLPPPPTVPREVTPQIDTSCDTTVYPIRPGFYLQIQHPASLRHTSATHLILHLPFHTPAATVLSHTRLLLSTSCSTVITPLYSPPVAAPPFPTFLHDSLLALDTVHALFSQSRIALFGHSYSGSTALALGLTETQRLRGLVGIAAHAPVVDLTTLGDVAWSVRKAAWLPFQRPESVTPVADTEKPLTPTPAPPYPRHTPEVRQSIFSPSPYVWVDPFASPLFFLRTTGLDFPLLGMPKEDPAAVLELLRHRRTALAFEGQSLGFVRMLTARAGDEWRSTVRKMVNRRGMDGWDGNDATEEQWRTRAELAARGMASEVAINKEETEVEDMGRWIKEVLAPVADNDGLSREVEGLNLNVYERKRYNKLIMLGYTGGGRDLGHRRVLLGREKTATDVVSKRGF